jgi:hypothetical protein
VGVEFGILGPLQALVDGMPSQAGARFVGVFRSSEFSAAVLDNYADEAVRVFLAAYGHP